MLTQMTWKKEIDDPLNPEAWAAMQKLSSSVSCFTSSTKMSKARSFIYNSSLIHSNSSSLVERTTHALPSSHLRCLYRHLWVKRQHFALVFVNTKCEKKIWWCSLQWKNTIFKFSVMFRDLRFGEKEVIVDWQPALSDWQKREERNGCYQGSCCHGYYIFQCRSLAATCCLLSFITYSLVSVFIGQLKVKIFHFYSQISHEICAYILESHRGEHTMFWSRNE